MDVTTEEKRTYQHSTYVKDTFIPNSNEDKYQKDAQYCSTQIVRPYPRKKPTKDTQSPLSRTQKLYHKDAGYFPRKVSISCFDVPTKCEYDATTTQQTMATTTTNHYNHYNHNSHNSTT